MIGVYELISSYQFFLTNFSQQKSKISKIAPSSSETISTSLLCKSILIVEDEKDIRESLQQILETEGYNVYSAENGQVALELLPNIQSPCLILLDLMMPIMNGWQFIETIRGNNILATIPVVIVTAYGDRAKTVKAQGFIKKPIDLDALLKVIKVYC